MPLNVNITYVWLAVAIVLALLETLPVKPPVQGGVIAGFEKESDIVKHLSVCWGEKNPYRKSKPAPRSEDINTREDNQDITDFFNSFK